jgi:FkbM family methyltransferase
MKKSISGLDVRITNYVLKYAKKYIEKKERTKAVKSRERWLEKFQDREVIVHDLANDLKINLYKDSVLSKLIYYGFETDEIDFVNGFLDSGDYFLDIGANIGLFTLYASKGVGVEGAVLSFEPSQKTFNRLKENCSLNGLTNVRSYRLGLSDRDENLELNISENGYEAWNTFVESDDQKFSRKELVSVKSLDHFLNEIELDIKKISLIKIDVEGFEMRVLKGAQQLLSGPDSPVFLIEFADANANSAGSCCHEIYKFLGGFGYLWYTYDLKHKLLVYDPMRINYSYVNLIAIRNLENNKNLKKFKIEHG